MLINSIVNKDYVDEELLQRVAELEVGDMVVVRWDPAAGKGKPQKLYTRNHGPYRIIGKDGDFFNLETITGFHKILNIHITRIKPFNWDPRCPRTALQVASDAERSSIVVSIVKWKLTKSKNKNKAIKDRLYFNVEFEDQVFRNVPYSNLKDNIVFLNWLNEDEQANVRELLNTNLYNLRRRIGGVHEELEEEKVKAVVVWKAIPPNMYMAEDVLEGFAISDVECEVQKLLENDLDDAAILTQDPVHRQDIKEIIKEFIDVFLPVKAGDFIKFPPVVYDVKPESAVRHCQKFLRSNPLRNPKAKLAHSKVITKLLEMGRIEVIPDGEVVPYNTPTFIKFEADKDRFLMASTHINKLINSRKFPMAYTVEDIFGKLAGMQYRSKFDAQVSYYQVLVDPAYRNFTAFTDPETGIRYRFKCLSMGMADSPCIMQELMQQCFTGETPYIDDIPFGDNTWEEHMSHMRKLLTICRDKNIKLKLSKCVFACEGYDLPCLGRSTNQKWRCIDDKTSERIRNMRRPLSVNELVSSLAKMNWLRSFVEKLGEIAAPLYRITNEKGKKIAWSDMPAPATPKLIEGSTAADAEVWNNLKEACANPQSLYFLEEVKRIFANSDASKDGWGFVIFQLLRDDLAWNDKSVDESGEPLQKELYVAINSGSFNKQQRLWTTTEHECFAFYRGIMDNKHLLYGREFILITDHLNLTFLVDSESEKVQRWKGGLQEFSITFEHSPGPGIPVPDWISRL